MVPIAQTKYTLLRKPHMNNKIVFTGGPGSGKTSVINYMRSAGYDTVPEVGRKVIQRQVDINGIALPWLDKEAFRDEMVIEETNNFRRCSNKALTLFDRSIVDSYGYSMLEQIPVPESLLKHCNELIYNQKVFVFPPWDSIYENDVERKQNFSEAIATYIEMVNAYHYFGYSLMEVPKVSVPERAKFILDNIEHK
ncbi:ATP-binding protein (plasmid) [Vibrio nigripulchritudo]|nr:ATP-binding protein [Vibrio nigripulchritudo]